MRLMFAVFGVLLFTEGVRLQWQIGRLMLTENHFKAEWLAPAAAGNFMMPIGIAFVLTGFMA